MKWYEVEYTFQDRFWIPVSSLVSAFWHLFVVTTILMFKGMRAAKRYDVHALFLIKKKTEESKVKLDMAKLRLALLEIECPSCVEEES